MRFYGQPYSEVMRLPLRTFWNLNSNVVRHRAEEALPMIELFMLGGMGATEEVVTSVRDHLKKQWDEPLKYKSAPQTPVDDLETTKAGISKLREMKERMVN